MAIFRPKPYVSIPNSPFYYPETSALSSTTGPLIIGSGIDIDYTTGVISATGGGGGSTNVQVTSPIVNTGTSANPVIGIQLANTLQLGAVRVGPNLNVSSGVISVNTATTTQTGIVRLNDTTTSPSDLEALTANQGRILQNQINAISVSGSLTLAATLDAATGQTIVVTAAGASAGFTVGANLPAPTPALSGYCVLVSTPGTYTPPGSSTSYAAIAGDWFLCNGSSWNYIPLGTAPSYATETAPGIIEIATAAEVQAGTDNTRAVTPATLSDTFVKSCVLDAKGSLIGASAAGDPINVALGSEGQVLTVCNAAAAGVAWTTAPASFVRSSCFTGQGQILAGCGVGLYGALAKGTNGYVLGANDNCALGVQWQPACFGVALQSNLQPFDVGQGSASPIVLSNLTPGCYQVTTWGRWCQSQNCIISGDMQMQVWTSICSARECAPANPWTALIVGNGSPRLMEASFSMTWALNICSTTDTVRFRVGNNCNHLVNFCVNTSAIPICYS